MVFHGWREGGWVSMMREWILCGIGGRDGGDKGEVVRGRW